MLQLIPKEHFQDIKLIVLRQPKRKERILSSVWGRLVYWANIGKFSGLAIYLEAQKANFTSHWSNSSTPDQAREDERLREDGHIIVADKRRHRLNSSLDSVRHTQLYRTLPHEVGHYVQYLQKVEEPSRDDLNKWMQLNARYHQIPSQEKEAFAHRYADEFRQRMFQESRLPFDRVLDENRLKQQGLSPEWFREPAK
jgi:predicted SprT family Zn-dependent metalloprotease